ncbi:MAG: heme-binding domain-containing protein [Planctomycetota bacterium]
MSKPTKRIFRAVLFLGLIGFVAIQFVPVDRTNPAVVETFAGDPELMAVLRRSCWDCHSNETVWPWYSYIAPMSWLIADHVHEGREALNFSDWDDSDLDDVREESNKEVRKGQMPMPSYLILHSDAKLSDADKQIFERWAKQ